MCLPRAHKNKCNTRQRLIIGCHLTCRQKLTLHPSTQLVSSGITVFCCNQYRIQIPTLALRYLQLDLIKINDNSKRNLEQELNGYKLDAQRQAKQIWALEREREAYGTQVCNKFASLVLVSLLV